MNKVSTRNLMVGQSVVIDGKPRIITAKEKAFKAPEWFIYYTEENRVYRTPFNSNKKWEVLELAVA